MALNIDFAPTFMDLAGLAVPADMQGRSLVPLLRGERPADWRTSMYYRYYHDPAHAETVAKLKTELYRLKQEVRDNDEFANAQPPPGADGQPPRPAGKRKL